MSLQDMHCSSGQHRLSIWKKSNMTHCYPISNRLSVKWSLYNETSCFVVYHIFSTVLELASPRLIHNLVPWSSWNLSLYRAPNVVSIALYTTNTTYVSLRYFCHWSKPIQTSTDHLEISNWMYHILCTSKSIALTCPREHNSYLVPNENISNEHTWRWLYSELCASLFHLA